MSASSSVHRVFSESGEGRESLAEDRVDRIKLVSTFNCV